MARKVQQEKVFCRDCVNSGKEENFLIECFDKHANPGGYKMGCWAKPCTHFQPKK
jgi:hypothetical protein